MLFRSDGKSAYQYAKAGGYTGTEAEFNAMLAQIDTAADATTATQVLAETHAINALSYAQDAYDAQIFAETAAINALDYLQQIKSIVG